MRHHSFFNLLIATLVLLAAGLASVSSVSGMGGGTVTSFTLINADSNSPITGFDPIPNGASINLATLPTDNLNIRANTNPATVGSVRFGLNGNSNYNTENTAPYALEGDSNGNYDDWTPPAGSYTLTGTPYNGANATGTVGTPLQITFTVLNTPNQLPVVNAGDDQALTLPSNSVTLNGSASDPDGSIANLQWTQVGGPSNATLGGTATLNLSVSNMVAGVYQFRLTATDNGGAINSDDAFVVVTDPNASGGSVSGELVKWHPVTVSFTGPTLSENGTNPNPFLDYRLNVTFIAPSGRVLLVPGFFDGDGNGNGTGNVWRVRFAPDEPGQWSYSASFRSGSEVNVSLDAGAGSPAFFDGAGGTFNVAVLDPSAPGFLKWGRWTYVDLHYLKFADGPYWLKGGTDSPENFFGYKGFDNTFDQQGGAGTSGLENGVHRYSTHVADWNNGDPNWVSADTGYDGKAIIGALNYLASVNVNSVYFLPMNLGGDGRETYPFIDPSGSFTANTQYDISKLHQWNMVFNHAQELGIAFNIVLAETESGNEQWFDNGTLGTERRLYYREMIARYGYHLALKWNLSEENDFSVSLLRQFADYIQALDWAEHPITAHTHTDDFSDYTQMVGDDRFTSTSIQYSINSAGGHVETWRANSAAAGRPWILDMDENSPFNVGLTDSNADDLRKRILYDVYFSGGQIEWYAGYHDLPLGGDMRLEDFRTREDMWNFMWYARSFLQNNLPFWIMEPHDELLTGEDNAYGGGEVFALIGSVYAIYLPDASNGGTLDLSNIGSDVELEGRWFNPRTGQFVGGLTTVNGGGSFSLGAPPSDADEDWVYLLQAIPLNTYIPFVVDQ